MHLSYNNCFTSNSFCLRLVFVASRGIIPLTIIWRCFNRFWKSKQRDTNKSVGYFARLSVSRLSVHSLLPHTWVTGRRTVRSGFYRHLRHLCRNFRPRHFYISLSLQQWSLLWQQLMYCFFAFRSATCLLCLFSRPFLQNLPVNSIFCQSPE